MAKQIHLNVDGTWKAIKTVWRNVGGTWQQDLMPYINVSGTWKECMGYNNEFIYLAYQDDNDVCHLRKYTKSGDVVWTYSDSFFYDGFQILVDKNNNSYAMLDTYTDYVKVDEGGNYVRTLSFNGEIRAITDSGNLIVDNSGNIEIYTPQGSLIVKKYNNNGYIRKACYNNYRNRVAVLEHDNDTRETWIQTFDENGNYETTSGVIDNNVMTAEDITADKLGNYFMLGNDVFAKVSGSSLSYVWDVYASGDFIEILPNWLHDDIYLADQYSADMRIHDQSGNYTTETLTTNQYYSATDRENNLVFGDRYDVYFVDENFNQVFSLFGSAKQYTNITITGWNAGAFSE